MDRAGALKLVDAPSGDETSDAAPDPALARAPSESRRLPAWLFIVALVLFAILVGWQAQVASGLKAEVVALEGRLERTNALLDAHRVHLSEIRGGVHELSESLLGLRALVDSDPSESVAPLDAEPALPTP